MTLLIVGIVVFFTIHLVPSLPPLRRRAVQRLGENTYKLIYTAVAAAGLILIIWGKEDRVINYRNGEVFAAAKGAVRAFTRSLALSLAPTVRVNCIAAGWIRTGWGDTAGEDWQQRVLRETPLGRWGEPIDVAHLARFLLSDESSYLTGQVIYANGGAER